MDMSTHMSASYLDTPIHFFYRGTIHSFQLVAVPLFTCHTGEHIYLYTKKILDILCPEWQSIMLSITTDGEKKMTGHIQGVATRFEQAALPGFFRIWCGLHQLDLVLQQFYTELMDKSFYGILTNLISYLRRQFNLIAEMKTKAKTVADTRWESMSKVSNWFKVHRVQLLQYLEEKNPICKPPMKWWLIILFIADISAYATATFHSLEGLTTLLFAQRQGLICLQSNFMHLFQAVGPMEGNANVDENVCALSDDRKFSASLSVLQVSLKILGHLQWKHLMLLMLLKESTV